MQFALWPGDPCTYTRCQNHTASCSLQASARSWQRQTVPVSKLKLSASKRNAHALPLSSSCGQSSRHLVQPRRCIKLGSSKVPIEQTAQDADRKWGVFQWKEYNRPWQVPWEAGTVALTMFAWAITFLGVALIVLPAMGTVVGVKDFTSMSVTDKSIYAFVNQVLETLTGLGIVFLATRKWMPLAPDLLKYDIREPFAKPRGWLAWGLLGVLLSPLVVGAAATAFSLFGFDETTGKGTVDGVAQILSLDFPSFASLFGVVAILAPLLEETIFRGFLLTSLTKFMPTWAAVFASSVAFGLAHLSVRDLPQLIVLGILLGFIYVRSRNLLSPMLIHGVWNGAVLSVLYFLVQSGVDLKELFSEASRACIHLPSIF